MRRFNNRRRFLNRPRPNFPIRGRRNFRRGVKRVVKELKDNKQVVSKNQVKQMIDNKITHSFVPTATLPSRRFNVFGNNFLDGDSALKAYNEAMKKYLEGLLFPEDAVSGSNVCKQPSYVGLPTTNVVFKEQINFKITSTQQFGLIWVPNYLSTVPSINKHLDLGEEPLGERKRFYSHTYFTTNLAQLNVWKLHSSYLPAVDLSKYRLVSAKISVQYNGSLLNQSGQMHSCVVYDDLPVFCGLCPNNIEDPAAQTDSILQNYEIALSSYCDIEKIRNGLWPKFVNITNTNGQIDNIALPSDPTDHTFFPLTHYYAQEPKEEYLEGADAADISLGKVAVSYDGGHLSYVYLGQGIPEGTNITVVVYYNFEVIPTQSTASFMRANNDRHKILDVVKDNYSKIVEQVNQFNSENNNLSKTGSGNKIKGFINTLANIVTKGAAIGGSLIASSKILPGLSKTAMSLI